jgi:hypothetical protein
MKKSFSAGKGCADKENECVLALGLSGLQPEAFRVRDQVPAIGARLAILTIEN